MPATSHHPAHREHVLIPTAEDGPCVFDVPAGAGLCRVPQAPEAPEDIRGREFVRTGQVHRLYGLAIFRPRSRQV